MSPAAGLHTAVPPDKGVTRQAPAAPLPNTYAGMMGRRVHAVVSRSSGQPSCERQPQVRVPNGQSGGERSNEQESSRDCSGKNAERLADRSSLTIGLDESPAGYCLASCSPAELASASPAIEDFEPKSLV